MTIFRHRHTRSASLTEDSSRPVLEAVTSSSSYLLADFDNKDNVVVSPDLLDLPDDISTASGTSSMTAEARVNPTEASMSNNPVLEDETMPEEQDDTAQNLSQAFLHDYSVKLDPDNNNAVTVQMEVPEGVSVEDLTVQVDDNCILRVAGEVPMTEPTKEDTITDNLSTDATAGSEVSDSEDSDSPPSKTLLRVEQAFQLDEQSLDIDKVKAQLCLDGTLTITAPKKDEEESTLQESLPILAHRPPANINDSLKDMLRIIIDVPGVHLADIHVSYANAKLRVSASRHFGRVRSFKRTLPIDTAQFDVDQMKVYLNKGRLTIHVPPKSVSSLTDGVRDIEIVEQV